jgi:hypothetical protein
MVQSAIMSANDNTTYFDRLIESANIRLADAHEFVAELPAEESPLTLNACYNMASDLVGDDDTPWHFAVYVALWERSTLQRRGRNRNG